MDAEQSADLRAVRAQIRRVYEGLLADVRRQAEVAQELTQSVPADIRSAVLANIDATRDGLLAFGAKIKASEKAAHFEAAEARVIAFPRRG